MSEIVGGCVSQFHNDEDRFELLLAYADGREIGHSMSRRAAVLLAKEIDAAFGGEYAEAIAVNVQMAGVIADRDSALAAKDAEIARLREALAPFAACADEIDYDDKERDDQTPDDEWAKFRLLAGDYRRARAALQPDAKSGGREDV